MSTDSFQNNKASVQNAANENLCEEGEAMSADGPARSSKTRDADPVP